MESGPPSIAPGQVAIPAAVDLVAGWVTVKRLAAMSTGFPDGVLRVQDSVRIVPSISAGVGAKALLSSGIHLAPAERANGRRFSFFRDAVGMCIGFERIPRNAEYLLYLRIGFPSPAQ